MKVLSRALIFVLFASSVAVSAAVTPRPDDVRTQLASYFRNIEQNSPTVLGGLAKSPEAMKAIQERIATMSDAEAAKFQKLLAETPDWKVAPEAFADAFPPDVLEQIRRVGADYAAQVPKAEKMRDEVRTLVEVLKHVPDAKLQELGVDRKTVNSLEETFAKMSPMQVAMLQRQTGDSAFREKSALAVHTLPPALRRGATALGAHGALSTRDVAELNQFRNELIALMVRVDALPPEAREKLKVEGLVQQVAQLKNAPPDVLFMVRHNLTPAMMTELRSNVAFLERISTFSEEEKKGLETFRTDFADALRKVSADGSEWQGVDEMVSGLEPQHLFLLQQQMNGLGDWQTALPAVYSSFGAAELPDRLRRIEGPDADPAAVAGLEEFRKQALAFVDHAGPTSGLDATAVGRARHSIETASLKRLELIRLAAERLPATASDKAKLTVALMHEINFGCSLNFQVSPRLCTPGFCVEVCDPLFDLGCVEECFPEVCIPEVRVDLNFDVICNPIEDAIETIEHGVTGIANTAINAMQTAIQTSLTAVQNTINNTIATVTNVINTTISAITSTVNDVWTFLQTVPDLAWNAIKSALNLLLDIPIRNGVTLRDLVARGAESGMTAMTQMLGLAGNWWSAISTFTLPAIPCPPQGFHTPFGNVGDGAAADNYGRYKLVIDGIIGMIPDTETSLAIKIPAQVLYMAFDFLGLCLEQAAAESSAQQLTARHNLVVTNFANMQAFVGTQLAGLGAASGSQTNALIALINTQSTSIQTNIVNSSTAIQAAITSETQALQTLVDQEATKIKNLIQSESDDTQQDLGDFESLNVKITIEQVLQAGVSSEVGSFQLRSPWGKLQRVSEIVKETIDAMTTAGEGVGQARKYYDGGMALMASGKDKEAFREFARAYQEATK